MWQFPAQSIAIGRAEVRKVSGGADPVPEMDRKEGDSGSSAIEKFGDARTNIRVQK